MNQTTATLILVVLVAALFFGMWAAWRKRSRRDLEVLPLGTLTGEVIAEFPRIFYVATTLQGEPLERVAVPGLKYRGYAAVRVAEDGLEIKVAGEVPALIPTAQLSGASTAQMRIDKVVERDGLFLVTWEARGRLLETSFRLNDRDEQHRMREALERILPKEAVTNNRTNDDTSRSGQEAK